LERGVRDQRNRDGGGRNQLLEGLNIATIENRMKNIGINGPSQRQLQA
jgi:hypothetical protein